MREIFINAEEGGVEPRVDAPKAKEQFEAGGGRHGTGGMGQRPRDGGGARCACAAALLPPRDAGGGMRWAAMSTGARRRVLRRQGVRMLRAEGGIPPAASWARYMRLYGGMAHYNLKMIEGGIRHLRAT